MLVRPIYCAYDIGNNSNCKPYIAKDIPQKQQNNNK